MVFQNENEMKTGVLGMLIATGTHSNFNRENLLKKIYELPQGIGIMRDRLVRSK